MPKIFLVTSIQNSSPFPIISFNLTLITCFILFKSLHALRIWIQNNNIPEESENRALRQVCLSWSGMEAMTDIKDTMKIYGILNSTNGGGTQMMKGDAFQQELEQRLFTLFELGNATISEFRCLHDLKTYLNLSDE